MYPLKGIIELTMKKEYKIRIENGKIEPLEPIDIEGVREGKIIFFDLYETSPPFKSKEKTIWEEIIEIGNSIPDEEIKKLPKDLAQNLDHYLYGCPKNEQ